LEPAETSLTSATPRKGKIDVKRHGRSDRGADTAVQGAAGHGARSACVRAFWKQSVSPRTTAEMPPRWNGSRMREAGPPAGHVAPSQRRKRIEAVLPQAGEPWAPPGRCATLWLILAEALENGHDAAGAELVHEMTECWLGPRAQACAGAAACATGWAAQAPILHLDATLRPELVQTYLPRIDIGDARRRAPAPCPRPPGDRQPDLGQRADALGRQRARAGSQGLPRPGCAISAPGSTLRARQCHRPGQAVDLLIVGQKAAIDAYSGPPACRRVSRRCISTR
jgi:hypothetical protein